jgi:hypothetical protein
MVDMCCVITGLLRCCLLEFRERDHHDLDRQRCLLPQ